MSVYAPLRIVNPVTAAAAGLAPLRPPREWFADPQLNELTPLTVTADGRVFGHIAPWGACHVGMPGCVPPPRGCDYNRTFHLGSVECADGTEVACGQITMDTDHPSTSPALRLTPQAVGRHYSQTGLAIADVRVGEDSFGPWVAGALRPDASAAKVRAFKAAKPSGDWRPVYGKNELIAILQVNSPGYPVPRAIAASASGEALAEVLGKPVDARLARRVLAARIEGGLAAVADLI